MAHTWAVAICWGLGDGAGKRTAADLRRALVEFLLLVSKLDLLKERNKVRCKNPTVWYRRLIPRIHSLEQTLTPSQLWADLQFLLFNWEQGMLNCLLGLPSDPPPDAALTHLSFKYLEAPLLTTEIRKLLSSLCTNLFFQNANDKGYLTQEKPH